MIRILQALSLVVPIVAAYTFPSGFDVNQVDSNTKAGWCRGERNTCPQICGNGGAQVNNCDPTSLNFTCTCSDGKDADVEKYQDTIPFYVCQANYGQCIARSSDQDADAVCKEAFDKCPSLNASDSTSTSSSSTTSSATSLPTESSSNSQSHSTPSATGASSTPTPTGAAVRLMQDYSMAVMATVMLVGFGLAL